MYNETHYDMLFEFVYLIQDDLNMNQVLNCIVFVFNVNQNITISIINFNSSPNS